MFLAKFFHKADGDDRLLLLSLHTYTLMGFYLADADRTGHDWSEHEGNRPLRDEFLRQVVDGRRQAIALFRQAHGKLLSQGFVETFHTNYTLRDLGDDFTPKPDWQAAIDEAVLSDLADRPEQRAEKLAALAGTPAAEQPITLLMQAEAAASARQPDALALAIAVRDRLESWIAEGRSAYVWSLPPSEVQARIYENLACCLLLAEAPDIDQALVAAERAADLTGTHRRLALAAWILGTHFPDREEDAYDRIYPYAGNPAYRSIVERPSFIAYVEGRKADAAAGRASWRWASATEPAQEAEILALENELDCELPPAYREFLQLYGKRTLYVRLPDDSAQLKFPAIGDLLAMRRCFLNFVTRVGGEAGAEAVFREAFGVSLDCLLPIAQPPHASNLLLIHLGPGENHGRCYVWNHEDCFDLLYEQPGFTEMLAELLSGIEHIDPDALDLFNIYVEPKDGA